MDHSETQVLIIDDQFPICTAVCGLLEYKKFKSSFALTAIEGLEALRKNPQTDIVLLDIDLGEDISGVELLPKIREISRYVQVVMLTSHNTLDVGLECMKHGAFDFMTKPFDEKLFVPIANVALERKKIAQLNDLYFDIIIHDLKNPLQLIMGAHEFIKDQIGESATPIQKKLFETAESGMRQIQTMIGNMMGISRFENGVVSVNREPIELIGLINNAAQLFRSLAPIEINFDIPNSYHIKNDKELFRRVLDNVVSNAIRFTTTETPILINIIDKKDALEVSVKNDGSFIPVELREAVFDKFSGVRPGTGAIRGQNYGLGLTFSKMAVEAMGGRIWVDSDEKMTTTTFSFTIKKFL